MVDRQKETGRIPRTIDCELTQDLGKFLVMMSIVNSHKIWVNFE